MNPAGLATIRDASIELDATIGAPTHTAHLRQWTIGFNSRGFSLGYQRDIFDGGARGHTYRLGFGAASGGLSGGFATALYRGNTSATGWDIGVTYDAGPLLRVGGVIANLGQPTVRGVREVLTYIPGASVRPFGPNALFSVAGRITSRAVQSYSFEARWARVASSPIQLLARLDTDRGLRRGAFAFGLAIGGQDQLGLVGDAPGDVSTVDALTVYGLSTRSVKTRRRR